MFYAGDELYGDEITSGPESEETLLPEDFEDWWREGETDEARWSSIEDCDRIRDDRLTDEAERGRA